jgi:hypothetical protein
MLYLQGEKGMYLRTCEIHNKVSHLRKVRKSTKLFEYASLRKLFVDRPPLPEGNETN